MAYANPFGAPSSGDAGADPANPPGGYFNYYLNNTPEAGFYYYLNKKGLVGNNPNQQYAQGQYNRTMGKYMANAADNPDEGFYDYLSRTSPDYSGDFASQAPEQRGDFTSRSLTPRGRFTRAY